MQTIPEYDLTRPDTLAVITEDEIWGQSERERFNRKLVNIAGRNPFGGRILELRWGPTYCDPMSTDPNQIKYLDFTDKQGNQLGERRFFVERWRSPEFLERSGRYQLTTRQDDDGTKLLKSIQPEGCYDYWIRLERKNLTYHAPNGEALEAIAAIWEFEKLPQNERDALEQADREIERRQIIAEQRRAMGGGIYTGAVPLIHLPS